MSKAERRLRTRAAPSSKVTDRRDARVSAVHRSLAGWPSFPPYIPHSPSRLYPRRHHHHHPPSYCAPCRRLSNIKDAYSSAVLFEERVKNKVSILNYFVPTEREVGNLEPKVLGSVFTGSLRCRMNTHQTHYSLSAAEENGSDCWSMQEL